MWPNAATGCRPRGPRRRVRADSMQRAVRYLRRRSSSALREVPEMSDARLLRHAVLVAERRREWRGAGGAAPENAESILALARGGKQCRWDGLGRRVGRGYDQVDL